MKTPPPLPKDPLHQRFADILLLETHVTNQAAYLRVYPKARPKSANTMAKRLLKRPDVIAYMTAVRAAAADDTTLSLLEKRRFLARIVRTPLLSIDPNHPNHKDGDLLLKYKNTTTELGGTEEIVKHCPLKAIEIDNKLSGDDPETNSLQAIAEALHGIAGNIIASNEDRM